MNLFLRVGVEGGYLLEYGWFFSPGFSGWGEVFKDLYGNRGMQSAKPSGGTDAPGTSVRGASALRKPGEESNHKGIEGMKQKMNLKSGMFNGLPAYACALLLLAAGLVLSVLYAVTVGSAELSVGEVYRVILYELFRWGDPEQLGSGAVQILYG